MNKKMLIYKIVLLFLLIAFLIIGGIILCKRHNERKYDNENKKIVQVFKQNLEEEVNENNGTKEIEVKMNGYNVIGLIKIPAINLEYPIIEKTTKATMNISISRFYGGNVNEFGNICLAGHNNYSGTMFGKNKNLKIDDNIYLTDLNTKTIEYKIYNIFTTEPNDVSILETTDKTIREVTLITCKNGRSERLIIKARENI